MANGFHRISNRMIQVIHSSNRKLLHVVFAKCLEPNYFLEVWKKGKLKPIKKLDKKPDNAKSLRSITLLPVLGKVLEKIIKHFLEEAFDNQYLLNDNQFAYRKSRGTEQAVCRVMRHANEYKKCNRHLIVISFDISAAFDKAYWSTILQNLRASSIPTTLIYMIKSFFAVRSRGYYDR